MDYITSQTPDKGVQIGPEPPVSNDSMALTPDKGVQIGKELPIINAGIALTPDKGVQIGKELPISNDSIAMTPAKGVQIGPEPPISNGSIAMTSDTVPGFAGNLIEAGIVINGTKSAVYKSTAYPANADGTQRPGAVVEYSSEFSVGEGFSVGGVKSELPAGYIRAEFLVGRGQSAYIDTGIVPNENTGLYWKHHVLTTGNEQGFNSFAANGSSNYYIPPLLSSFGTGYAYGGPWNYLTVTQKNILAEGWLNYKNDRTARLKSAVDDVLQNLIYTDRGIAFKTIRIGWSSNPYEVWNSRFYTGQITQGASIIRDFIPCLEGGEVGVYDKISKRFFKNSGSLQFIAGFTLPQALNLRNLPTTGGTLTISLPEGYDSNTGVMAALETARSKGWTLTIQTYTPENVTETTSTFALRRIWVRKTQDENGGYVDADEKRWQVDWCVDMLTPDGSTPDVYGYEMFRSIDAAATYWELTPYVDPETEEEFSQEL